MGDWGRQWGRKRWEKSLKEVERPSSHWNGFRVEKGTSPTKGEKKDENKENIFGEGKKQSSPVRGKGRVHFFEKPGMNERGKENRWVC